MHPFELLRWYFVEYGYWTVAAVLLLENAGIPVPGETTLQRRFFHVSQEHLERGERFFRRYGSLTIFFARFLFGMRIIAGPMAGVLKMPWKQFFTFNFLGAAVWVSVIASLGYFFGSRWRWLLTRLQIVDVTIAVLVLLGALVLWRKRRTG